MTTMQSYIKDLDNVQVDVRYYKPDKWRKLSNDQRKKCILTRRIQLDQNPSLRKRKSCVNDNSDKQTNHWKKEIEKQGRIIPSLKAARASQPLSGDPSIEDQGENKKNKVSFNTSVTQRGTTVDE